MLRSDGTPFNRETEHLRWDYVEAVETRLLREKTVFETVRDMEMLYAEAIGADRESQAAYDAERNQFLMQMQRRLHSLAHCSSPSHG